MSPMAWYSGELRSGSAQTAANSEAWVVVAEHKKSLISIQMRGNMYKNWRFLYM
jgi:hypothetical protein